MPPKVKALTDEQLNEILKRTSEKFADEGRLILAGWEGFMQAFRRPDGDDERGEMLMRFAFYAGAHHLFTAMAAMFPPGGEEISELDIDRFNKLQNEVEEFGEIMKQAIRDRGH